MIENSKLHTYINKAIQSGVAFAVWNKPNSNETNFQFIQKNELIEIYSYTEIDKNKGFIFAPSKSSKKLPIYVFPFKDNLNTIDFESPKQRQKLLGNKSIYNSSLKQTKQTHIKQVTYFIEAFKNKKIKKTVLSRNKWLSDYQIEQMPLLFNKLRGLYPQAFVYQVFIPDTGYWVGATPELLFELQNETAKTVSLAGTQPFSSKIKWCKKELIEQELVTKHIRSVLKNFKINNYTEQGPVTSKAANLAHLETAFEFNSENIKNSIGAFIDSLHPTPAVCGLPVKESLKLIQQTESYDREYYTGFLGPFNSEESINLYVNLRCLKAFDNGVVLYAGGGITNESNPEKEWEETCLKFQTLESTLREL